MRQADVEADKRGIIDRSLGLFASVRRGEGGTALLLMINVFILLTAYYVVKPVREALILGESGAEIKSYASAGQAALFLLIIPLYGKWASRVNRVWLMNGVMAFFMANLGVFFVLGRLGVALGIAFYLWVGLFNLMLVAQFWAFANDLYTRESGERLFGVVGIGASLGAIVGAMLAGWMFEPMGPYSMMLVCAGLLGIAMILTNWIHHRATRSADPALGTSTTRATEKPLGTAGGFHLILNNRYLLFIALLVLLSNCVNTTGEFILGKTVAQAAQTLTSEAPDAALAAKAYIGRFYADFFFWVNVLGAGLQMFIVSRLMQWRGARSMLFVLPIIAFGSYAMLALVPLLSLIRTAKIFENSIDYSIQNTARHALFLPTSREEKYKAQAAIDGFFWRAGDTVSGLIVFIGAQLAFAPRTFAAVNLVLVAAWIGIAFAIVRQGKPDRAARVAA